MSNLPAPSPFMDADSLASIAKTFAISDPGLLKQLTLASDVPSLLALLSLPDYDALKAALAPAGQASTSDKAPVPQALQAAIDSPPHLPDAVAGKPASPESPPLPPHSNTLPAPTPTPLPADHEGASHDQTPVFQPLDHDSTGHDQTPIHEAVLPMPGAAPAPAPPVPVPGPGPVVNPFPLPVVNIPYVQPDAEDPAASDNDNMSDPYEDSGSDDGIVPSDDDMGDQAGDLDGQADQPDQPEDPGAGDDQTGYDPDPGDGSDADLDADLDVDLDADLDVDLELVDAPEANPLAPANAGNHPEAQPAAGQPEAPAPQALAGNGGGPESSASGASGSSGGPGLAGGSLGGLATGGGIGSSGLSFGGGFGSGFGGGFGGGFGTSSGGHGQHDDHGNAGQTPPTGQVQIVLPHELAVTDTAPVTGNTIAASTPQPPMAQLPDEPCIALFPAVDIAPAEDGHSTVDMAAAGPAGTVPADGQASSGNTGDAGDHGLPLTAAGGTDDGHQPTGPSTGIPAPHDFENILDPTDLLPAPAPFPLFYVDTQNWHTGLLQATVVDILAQLAAGTAPFVREFTSGDEISRVYTINILGEQVDVTYVTDTAGTFIRAGDKGAVNPLADANPPAPSEVTFHVAPNPNTDQAARPVPDPDGHAAGTPDAAGHDGGGGGDGGAGLGGIHLGVNAGGGGAAGAGGATDNGSLGAIMGLSVAAGFVAYLLVDDSGSKSDAGNGGDGGNGGNGGDPTPPPTGPASLAQDQPPGASLHTEAAPAVDPGQASATGSPAAFFTHAPLRHGFADVMTPMSFISVVDFAPPPGKGDDGLVALRSADVAGIEGMLMHWMANIDPGLASHIVAYDLADWGMGDGPMLALLLSEGDDASLAPSMAALQQDVQAYLSAPPAGHGPVDLTVVGIPSAGWLV